MDDLIFRIIVAVLLVSFMIHRGYYTRKVQHSDDAVIDQPQLGVLSRIASLLALPAFIATLVYIFIPRWVSWSAIPFPKWMQWLGVVIGLAGFGLLQWSQNTLGKNWSDDPKLVEGQSLITSGPYRWIRNPIYSAFLVIFASLTLISANWLIGLLWLGMTTLDIAARISAEEILMLQQFGDEYRTYMNRTGRILPRFRSKSN